MYYSPPGFYVHGILQSRTLEWVAIPLPGDLPNPGIEPRSLALQVDSLPSESLGGLLLFYLTQELFRSIKYSQGILLFLISSLIPIWKQNTFHMISTLWNVLRLKSWSIEYILVNVSGAFGSNVYSWLIVDYYTKWELDSRYKSKSMSLQFIRHRSFIFVDCQFSSAVQFCPTLCHPMDYSMPGLPCLTPTPGVYSNWWPSSQWWHPTISSSVIPFSYRLLSFPASGSFQISQLFTSGGQRIGVSALASILPTNIQGWFYLRWTGWISLQSKGLSSLLQHHSSKAPILQCSIFFIVQFSHPYMTTGKTIALTRPTFVGKECHCFLICRLGWS